MAKFKPTADIILAAMRGSGLRISWHATVTPGGMIHQVTARSPRTGEAWSARARDKTTAVHALAALLGKSIKDPESPA